MRQSVLFQFLVVIGVCALVAGETVQASQILYNTASATNPSEQLRQVNPDKSNNILLQIGDLPQLANPQVSRDGRFLSVRSQDPGRIQFSSNIYVLDSANGSLRKITHFEDTTDPDTGNTSNHSPRYTTFSPDGSMIAISSYQNIQTVSSGLTTFASSAIYRVSDGALLDGPSIFGPGSSLNTVGTGISWSASSNRVAVSAINDDTGATAIFSGNSLLGIPLVRETSPSLGFVNNGNYVEEDSFPTYSPNGVALAYFRSRDFSTFPQPTSSRLWLRIKSPSGGDRSIFDFGHGLQPTGISWSPDGTQLVIGVGPQAFSNGVFSNVADVRSADIRTINVFGPPNVQQLVGAVAFSPAWSSLQSGGPPADLNNDGFVDGLDLGILLGNFDRNASSAGGELNGTSPVDGLDLGILLGAWNPPALGGVAVPEPSSSALLGFAAVFGFCLRQRIGRDGP